ncbi:MAG TPA: type II toxin-antitoxin system RelB/DinJ family antitoxin, partial [Bacillota bacterium]|nr:type II toxin-antitoxin system RelB/DinJ family antitoxin [Bacillota bacterium]
MSGQSLIQVRIDNDVKHKANEIFEEIGIDMPTAIRMFLKRTISQKGLPFDINLPAGAKASGEITKMTVTHIPAKPS